MNDQPAGRPIGQGTLPPNALGTGQLRDSFEFLRGFVRNPAQVGSVIPSSRWLEQRLVRQAGVREAQTVVELGPGTGGTTAAMLQAMVPGARLLAIELDRDFHQHLQATIRDPRLLLELGSAERIAEALHAHHLPPPDAIVSGIPFSTMPPAVSDRIAAAIAQVLRPGGRFVAYQVRAHVAGFVTPYLGEPDKQWELVNVPPVRVFTWVKRTH
ncbi:class I SAM-dependent methyltransferase [Ramlibacter sp.]|uniref:class I SAM-dependent methyltransferase n=1 Tax=Ramlibacter sp. TaxID=1917967 RepID=UPI002B841A14|nr:rRNA adenine N-6-methyltransferase family protein [Ramlibacter sp.]HWI81326.1 rRNA adenine N-6-methyltransferase family protein [Ramlibacter sp.]